MKSNPTIQKKMEIFTSDLHSLSDFLNTKACFEAIVRIQIHLFSLSNPGLPSFNECHSSGSELAQLLCPRGQNTSQYS